MLFFYEYPLLQILAMQEKLSEQKEVITQLQAKKQEREAELKQEVGPKFTLVFLSTEVKLQFVPAAERHSCRVSFYHDGCFSQVLQLEQNIQELREERIQAEAQTATSPQVSLKKKMATYGSQAILC